VGRQAGQAYVHGSGTLKLWCRVRRYRTAMNKSSLFEPGEPVRMVKQSANTAVIYSSVTGECGGANTMLFSSHSNARVRYPYR